MLKRLTQSFRWYGPNDPVTLQDIRQAGASDIVTALHHIPNGEIWTLDEIRKRQDEVNEAGLTWSVVESLPVSESIKTWSGDVVAHIENYKHSLRNLATAGIKTITYNFMPILDWTRTDLTYRLPSGAQTLRYDSIDVAMFDLHILNRNGASNGYTPQVSTAAAKKYESVSETEVERITKNIIKGLPGAEEGYTVDQFKQRLAEYDGINADKLRSHLIAFLKEVVPVAEEGGQVMVVHPDDPPFSLFGLPRIVSTAGHLEAIFSSVPSPANGLCFCTGSFGVRPDNDLVQMAKQFADRVYFLHFRSTQRDGEGNFHEADHLEGDANIPEVIKVFIDENQRRDTAIPFRPDHGYQMLDDLNKHAPPGYSCIGRMKGLAELRGLERGLLVAREDSNSN